MCYSCSPRSISTASRGIDVMHCDEKGSTPWLLCSINGGMRSDQSLTLYKDTNSASSSTLCPANETFHYYLHVAMLSGDYAKVLRVHLSVWLCGSSSNDAGKQPPHAWCDGVVGVDIADPLEAFLKQYLKQMMFYCLGYSSWYIIWHCSAHKGIPWFYSFIT